MALSILKKVHRFEQKQHNQKVQLGEEWGDFPPFDVWLDMNKEFGHHHPMVQRLLQEA